MILKCIGGPNHLEYQNVPNNYCEGDLVRLITYPKFSINETLSNADSVKVDYNFYVFEILRFIEKDRSDSNEFKFLRYKDISMSEALRIALVY